MKSLRRKLNITFLLLLSLICCYIIGYPCLRLSRVLIARDYTIYKRAENGDRLIEDHFDIEHGPAMVSGKKRPGTLIGTIYKPISFVEVYLRGYGDYPTSRIAIECPD